ncbi:hypothetical protein LXA43DRAFT_1019835 [Ganoderma leucocontextum]|nr:hypothetical protein LXA43DRAFT_1019835 [Ganoderma leucocontextum]
MQRQPQRVQLDADSLYISTTPLLNGVFHWAFIHIDKNGKATRHHWIARDPNFVQGPEGYSHSLLPLGAQDTSRAGALPVLAYFKVTDYPPMSVADFGRKCAAVFSQSWPTAQQNRHAGITCRTWLINVLAWQASLGMALVLGRSRRMCPGGVPPITTYTTDFLFTKHKWSLSQSECHISQGISRDFVDMRATRPLGHFMSMLTICTSSVRRGSYL